MPASPGPTKTVPVVGQYAPKTPRCGGRLPDESGESMCHVIHECDSETGSGQVLFKGVTESIISYIPKASLKSKIQPSKASILSKYLPRSSSYLVAL